MKSLKTYQMALVLIESDWNLKIISVSLFLVASFVLIESDWNLKILAFAFNVPAASVLIESDWNLKVEMQKTSGSQSEY